MVRVWIWQSFLPRFHWFFFEWENFRRILYVAVLVQPSSYIIYSSDLDSYLLPFVKILFFILMQIYQTHEYITHYTVVQHWLWNIHSNNKTVSKSKYYFYVDKLWLCWKEFYFDKWIRMWKICLYIIRCNAFDGLPNRIHVDIFHFPFQHLYAIYVHKLFSIDLKSTFFEILRNGIVYALEIGFLERSDSTE